MEEYGENREEQGGRDEPHCLFYKLGQKKKTIETSSFVHIVSKGHIYITASAKTPRAVPRLCKASTIKDEDFHIQKCFWIEILTMYVLSVRKRGGGGFCS